MPVVVARGDQDQVIPRELLDRTWRYVRDESGAATVAHRGQGGHGISGPALATVAAWLEDRQRP